MGGVFCAKKDEQRRSNQKLRGVLALLRARTSSGGLSPSTLHRERAGRYLSGLDFRHGQSMVHSTRTRIGLRLRLDRPFLCRTQQASDVSISALVVSGRLEDVASYAARTHA